jgi:hypothetical protein
MRHWMTSTDPKIRAQVLKVTADLTKQPVENFEEWVYTTKDQYRALDLKIDVPRLQKNIDDIHSLGIVKQSIDVKNYVDMSLAEEAWKRFQASK